MRYVTTTMVMFLLLGSCDGGPPPPDSVQEATAAATDPAQDAGRKIVRTGEMLLAVDDLDVAHTRVVGATKAAGGHVAGDRVTDRGRFVQRTLRLRVPAAGFEQLVATIERLGRPEQYNVTAEEVTAQWIDLAARVRAKREMENRFLALVGRAGNVGEVMHIERELGAVRGEIEAMESKQRALEDQVALSTLTVTLSAVRTEPSLIDAPDFTAALSTGWTALLRCLAMILTAWPLLAAVGLAIVYRRVRRPRIPPLPAAS